MSSLSVQTFTKSPQRVRGNSGHSIQQRRLSIIPTTSKKKILPSSDFGLQRDQAIRLVLLLLTLLANNVEELEGVLALVGGDDAEPVTELLLLEELLRQVLEVAAGELLVSDDLDAAVAEVGDVDALAEVAGEAVNLDALLEEGGEGGGVEDTVVHGLGSVDDELFPKSANMRISQLKISLGEDIKSHIPYLLGDLGVLLGALEAAAAGSGSLLHRSQYTALKPAARIFLLARSERTIQGVGAAQQSEIRTGPCTILSVLEVIWGEELVEILGRKEMGILRRAELEGLHIGRAIRDWLRSPGGCRIVNLGRRQRG